MNRAFSLYQVVKEAEGDKPEEEEFEDLPEGEAATDYTADTEKEDDVSDEEPSDDGNPTDEEDDTSTDYTVDSEETDGEDTETDTTDETDTVDDTSTETEEDSPSDVELNRQLLNDYISLHTMCGTTTSKLTQIDKSNIIVNQIVARVTSNINQIEKHLYEFIVFSFGKGKYPYNLYKYNQFVEAFRVNVEMLKKINVLTSDSQNN